MNIFLTLANDPGPDLFGLFAAILGALAGAAAGAIPSYWLAERASKETLRRDQQARSEHERALAFRLVLSFTGIVNELDATRQQIEAGIAKAEETLDPSTALWIRMPPFIGNSDRPLDVPTEEIALLFAADKADLAADVLQLINRHRIFLTVIDRYVRRRSELGDRLRGPVGADPQKIQEKALFRHGPVTVEVDSLAHQIRRSLAQDSAEAIRLLPLLANALGEYFNKPDMFTVYVSAPGVEAVVA